MHSHEKAVNKRQCYKEGIAQVLPVGLFARVTCVAVKSTARAWRTSALSSCMQLSLSEGSAVTGAPLVVLHYLASASCDTSTPVSDIESQ